MPGCAPAAIAPVFNELAVVLAAVCTLPLDPITGDDVNPDTSIANNACHSS